MKVRNILLFLLVITSLVFAQQEPAVEMSKPKLGDPALEITGLEWIKNGPVEIKKGTVFVVEFWATWCGPCKVTIPHLTEVQEKFKDKGVTIIGISNEAVPTVEPFVENKGAQMNYAVAVDTDGSATRGFMAAYGQSGIPTAFIIDKDNRIVWYGHPLADFEDVLAKVVDGTFDVEEYRRQIEEARILNQKLNGYAAEFFNAIMEKNPEQAAQAGDKIVNEAPADFLNEFAAVILTRLPEDMKDLSLAVRAAEKANRLTEGKDFNVLNTYALALYESAKEQMQLAADIQKKAIELSDKDNQQMQNALKMTLEKYQKAADALGEEPKQVQ